MSLTKEDLQSISNLRDEKIEDLAQIIAKGFNEVRGRFEQIDRRFEQIDKKFEQIDKRFNSLEYQMNSEFRKVHAELKETKDDLEYKRQEHLMKMLCRKKYLF